MITTARLVRLSARALTVPVAAIALSLSIAVTASAASGYALFGDATLVAGHNSATGVQLRSDATPGWGGVDFDVPAGMTFSQLTNLSTDYNFTHNSCAGGAPRFQINFGIPNAFVYIGPPPNYTDCPMNTWLNTGDLATPAGFIDTSQLPGGTFYDTFAAAYVKYGAMTISGIQLVTDGGWKFSDGTQTVVVDNVMINTTAYTFEPEAEATKDSCKKGGWRDFTSAPGPFKNQGDCVSYFATGGRNKASGD